jgi:AcrR family transcriptional regulator
MTAAVPEPRKTPQQARSRATCAAIVEAAARILETDGDDGLTTNRVAEVAGVSIGTLYQYFPDKLAIVMDLIRRERAAMLEELRTIGDDAADPLSEMLDAAIRHQFARPKMALALERLEAAFGLDAENRALAAAVAEEGQRLLRAQWGSVSPLAVADAIAIARALTNGAADGSLSAQDLKQRLIRAVGGYLRLEISAAEES